MRVEDAGFPTEEPPAPEPGPVDPDDPDATPPDPADAEPAEPPAPVVQPSPWYEWLQAVDVGDGVLEYELQELPHAEVTDPETGEIVGLSAAGVLLFPDGTRIQHGATGTLLISREGHPEVSISHEEQRVVVKAYFADGLVVETTPQELDPSTE